MLCGLLCPLIFVFERVAAFLFLRASRDFIFAIHLAHLPGWGASNGDGSGALISASVRDLWARAENGTHTSSFTAAVEPHATVLVRLRRVHTAREWQHTARPPVRGGSEVLRTI